MATAPEIKVERGIPIPTLDGRGAGKYPWRQMEVGDSFFVPSPPKWFSTTISAMSRRYDRKFASRAVDGGRRVWRLA